MSLRNWLEKNTLMVTAAAVLILLAALAVIVFQIKGPTAPKQAPKAYFYDLEKKEVLTETVDKIPPADFAGRHGVVRAYIYACGECTPAGADAEHVAYIEQYSEEAKAAAAKRNASGDPTNELDDIIKRGDFYSGKNPVQWVLADSNEGKAVVARSWTFCGGKKVTICDP